MKQVKFKYKTLCLLLLSGFSLPAWAEGESTEATELETIRVEGQRTPTVLGRDRQSREQLDREMVQDIRDMVRYDPSITVVEGGRAGSNGFAMRGVDKDRVAITVDGLEQGESRSSSAFEELFAAYGNFNANRNAAELEHMSEATISKGADSITAGSGALGGSVIYRTKTPRDYVDEEKPYHLGLKTGWFSRSNQWMGSATAAFRLGNFDALAVLTSRHGHETKIHTPNYGLNTYSAPIRMGNTLHGVSRGVPDPQDIESTASLLRVGYHFNPNHYLSGIWEETREDRETKEFSNLFQTFSPDGQYRQRLDVSYRRRFGFEYENLMESGLWDKLTLTWDKQSIDMTTFTWDRDVNPRYLTASSDFKNRVLKYELSQWRLVANKNLSWDNFSWDLAYGLGVGDRSSSNSNLEYRNYLFYPHVLGSTVSTNEFLVGSRTRTRYAFLNNTFRLNQRFKLGLGVRYDRQEMRTLDSPNLQARNRQMLQDMGIWNARNTFNMPSYVASFDWNMTPSITLQAKYSTAFRAPTTDEMYLFFPMDDFYILPNKNLRAERARNIELGIDARGDWGFMKLSAFRTRYSDFLDFDDRGWQSVQPFRCSSSTCSPQTVRVYQNQNLNQAIVRGIELQSRFNLHTLGLPQGTYATLAATYQKGTAEGRPMNAIQPFNGVIGLGYQQPDDRWGLSTQISYVARKNPRDTVPQVDSNLSNTVNPYARFHQSYWLVDVTGHYRIGKHMTLRGGIYNLFNRRYYTWDSIRSIREFGTVNRINNQNFGGIERFQSPGRNFTLVLEAKF